MFVFVRIIPEKEGFLNYVELTKRGLSSLVNYLLSALPGYS